MRVVDRTARTVATVLVVEDVPEVAGLYREWLERSGHDVHVANDGHQALDLMDDTVDVVLLDRMLPDLAGETVLERFRAAAYDCRVVFVSAIKPALDLVQVGFDAYIEKPVDRAELLDTVGRMLERSACDRRLQRLLGLYERRQTLVGSVGSAVLEDHGDPQALAEKIETTEREVERLLTTLSGPEFERAVEQLRRTAGGGPAGLGSGSLTEDLLGRVGDGAAVTDAAGRIVWASKSFGRLLQADTSDLRGTSIEEMLTETVRPVDEATESRDRLVRATADADGGVLAGQGEPVRLYVRGQERPPRHLEYSRVAVQTGSYAGGAIHQLQDITETVRRERDIESLHVATRRLMDCETSTAVTEATVDIATDTLGLPYVALLVRDEQDGSLQPETEAVRGGLGHEPPVSSPVESGDGPLWRTFVRGSKPLTAGEVSPEDPPGPTAWLTDALRDWIVCPVEGRALLVVGAFDTPLSARRRQLAVTWATTVERALDRTARSAALSKYDRVLARQNEQLRRLDQTNRLVRAITRVVAEARTQEAIERETCERLLEVEAFDTARFLDFDPLDGTLAVGTALGESRDAPLTADGVEATTAASAGNLPAAARAVRSEEPVLLSDLTELDSRDWTRRTLEQGTQGVLAVPVGDEDSTLGVLDLRSDAPLEFSGDEVEVFAELGAIVGHAIAAANRRLAVSTDGTVELVLSVTDDPWLEGIGTAFEGVLEVMDVVYGETGPVGTFARVRPSADCAETPRLPSAYRWHAPDDGVGSQGTSHTTGATVGLRLDPDSVVARLLHTGGRVRVLRFGSAEPPRIAVTLPTPVNVREYLARADCDGKAVSLLAKRERARRADPPIYGSLEIDEALTRRQRETLQAAFNAGYFDWPRRADSRTVAMSLDISQPTFQEHLRAAERKLLTELYGESNGDEAA